MDGYNDYGGAFAAAYFATLFVLFLVAVALYIVSAIFYNKLFEKAGVEGRWRGWVPIYRELVFVKLGDLSPWPLLVLYGAAILLGWIPFIGWLFGIAASVYLILGAYRVGQKLQKEGAWVVLYIFLSIVWLGIVAYDKSRWNPSIGPAPWGANNLLADRTVWQGIPVQPAGAGTVNRADFAPPPDWTPGYAPPAPGSTPPPPAGYTPPPAGYTPPPPGGATPPPPGGATPPPTTQPPPPDGPPRV